MPAEPRTHGSVEIEGTDEGTSQRYLALATLKALQNLPQYDLIWLPSYLHAAWAARGYAGTSCSTVLSRPSAVRR